MLGRPNRTAHGFGEMITEVWRECRRVLKDVTEHPSHRRAREPARSATYGV